MRVKHEHTGQMCNALHWNAMGLSEIIIRFDDGDMTSDYARDYETLDGKRIIECHIDPPLTICSEPCPHV